MGEIPGMSAGHVEERGDCIRSAEGVRGAHGVAVHRRAGKGREILRRGDIGAADPVKGVVQRDGFNVEAVETGECFEYLGRRYDLEKFGHDLLLQHRNSYVIGIMLSSDCHGSLFCKCWLCMFVYVRIGNNKLAYVNFVLKFPSPSFMLPPA
jgi:hypothetical protein